ncbi:MAG: rhomboid family intramembrane serine protease [Thermodesulfovibrionales bacterium]|nr:rhomboid family intramembrane serine protease [Thermodesulfovibrionales bacterium]
MLSAKVNISMEELPKATLAIIASNVLFFICLLVAPPILLKSVLEVFAYGPANFYMPFAPATSVVLHAGVLALVFNCVFLLLIGPGVEARAGLGRFLLVYFVAGFMGSALEMGARMFMHGVGVPGAAGASGAISGIMGLLVYRHWYSRQRVTLEPGFVELDFELPAAPFIVIWFMGELVIGTQSMGGFVISSGHVAQAGGFVAGLLCAKVLGYGHEGRLDVLRKNVMDRFHGGGRWETAARALKKLRDMAPEDAGVQRDLARLYAKQHKKKESSLYFRHAVDACFKSDPMEAARTIIEHAEILKLSMSIQVHHKVARELVNMGLKKEGQKVMIAALRRKAENTPPYEQAIVFYVLLLLDMGEKKEAKRAYGIFKQRFPQSQFNRQIMGSVKKPLGSIFPVTKQPPVKAGPVGAEAPGEEALRFGPMSLEVAVDPWMVPTWFVLFVVLAGLDVLDVLPGAAVSGLSGLGWQLLVMALAVFVTAQRKFLVIQRLVALIRKKIEERKALKKARAEAEEAEEDDDDEDEDEEDEEPGPAPNDVPGPNEGDEGDDDSDEEVGQ